MEQKPAKPSLRPPTDEELKEMMIGLVEQSRKTNPAQLFKFVKPETEEKVEQTPKLSKEEARQILKELWEIGMMQPPKVKEAEKPEEKE